ncbi:MAG: ABC transporter ATP-binding protein [Armatimonadota bacterium]|nr:ABC transporter ATP-binding protein [Armatimonadota bacterium]MDR7495124.1 ABC transporter ATP-binding protein [Armatimonadota bacterium]MDR7500543.1 ABC transporter ATP-binding protein [Armatimonadota bacterium]MDR7505882.1 ABC transporter ATP-binding protein [Armatimonadota bacterium]MDR7546208.1 ABC transporter ATP-binding protein [Armatimonadota bacterium]
MTTDVLLEAEGVSKTFPLTVGLLRRRIGEVRAVEDVTLAIRAGETLALVGESGSGKTTLAKVLIRLLTPTSGLIRFEGRDLTRLPERALQSVRRQMQIVFQDPASSLNPRRRVKDIVAAPLEVHGIGTPRSRLQRVGELLERVELPPRDFMFRYPHALSGGQRQRVAIARALALEPKFVVLDEPTSALDVSVQAKIVALLKRLQGELSLTYLFISHDLSLVRNVADTIAVMYLGKVVEIAQTEELFRAPSHPYTRALLSTIPVVDDAERALVPEKITLTGEIPSAARIPPGCAFHPRCYARFEECDRVRPELVAVAPHHRVRCILYDPAHGARGLPRAAVPAGERRSDGS